MQHYVIALVIILSVWFLFGFAYINHLKRKIDRRCDELRRQIVEGSGDE